MSNNKYLNVALIIFAPSTKLSNHWLTASCDRGMSHWMKPWQCLDMIKHYNIYISVYIFLMRHTGILPLLLNCATFSKSVSLNFLSTPSYSRYQLILWHGYLAGIGPAILQAHKHVIQILLVMYGQCLAYTWFGLALPQYIDVVIYIATYGYIVIRHK